MKIGLRPQVKLSKPVRSPIRSTLNGRYIDNDLCNRLLAAGYRRTVRINQLGWRTDVIIAIWAIQRSSQPGAAEFTKLRTPLVGGVM